MPFEKLDAVISGPMEDIEPDMPGFSHRSKVPTASVGGGKVLPVMPGHCPGKETRVLGIKPGPQRKIKHQ